MYDEDLIEDSLAFAKEIKAFLNEKQANAAETGSQPASQQASSALQEKQTAAQVRPTGQPQPRPAQQTTAQVRPTGQPQPRPVQQGQATGQPQSRPVQQTAAQVRPPGQPQPRPVQQGQATGQPQPRPVQQTATQVRPTGQPQPRPAQQTATQVRPTGQPVSQVRPVAQPTPQPHPVQQGQTVSQPTPIKQEKSVADEAIQKLKAMRKAEEEARKEEASAEENRKAESNVVQNPEIQNPEIPGHAEPVDGENRHTYEITIKFDLDGIKKKFNSLKKKLAPETRTLEDVNAAMEENRQLMEEKENQEKRSLAENSVQIAGKAKGIARKLPKLMKRKEVSEIPLAEDADALDAEIKTLEEDGAEGKIAARLENVKAAIPQKASYASRLVTNILILIFCVGIAYFFASFVTSYVAHQTTVEGESMEPTLSDGDNVIIQRLSYYFKSPSRYDVVVFPVSYDEAADENTYYIKRVIGLPGETVQIIDGSVYINGSQLKDDKYALSDILEAGVAAEPLVLGEGQYFVMGDNRNMSTDSRNSYVGLVNRDDIVGEAWICTWPLNHFGSLKR